MNTRDPDANIKFFNQFIADYRNATTAEDRNYLLNQYSSKFITDFLDEIKIIFADATKIDDSVKVRHGVSQDGAILGALALDQLEGVFDEKGNFYKNIKAGVSIQISRYTHPGIRENYGLDENVSDRDLIKLEAIVFTATTNILIGLGTYDYLDQLSSGSEVNKSNTDSIFALKNHIEKNIAKLSMQTIGVKLSFDTAVKNKLNPIVEAALDLHHIQDIPIIIENGDQLRNVNSYEYLYHLAKYIPDELNTIPIFYDVHHLYLDSKKYDANIAYGDLYTKFQLALQRYISDPNRNEQELERIDDLVIHTYANENRALERAYVTIKDELHTTRQTKDAHTKKLVSTKLKVSTVDRLNKIIPTDAEHIASQFKTNYTGDMLAMTTTSQPMVMQLSYQNETDPKQLRFGTIGQFYSGKKAHLNPIFLQYLKAIKRRTDNEVPIVNTQERPKARIQHIYFNNLERKTKNALKDYNPFSPVRREKEITRELEKLNGSESNIAVITLPADGGYLEHKYVHDRIVKLDNKSVFDDIIDIAQGNVKHGHHQHDFFISNDVKQLLYGSADGLDYNGKNEREKLSELLRKSFDDLNLSYDIGAKMSAADRQAVFFHFIKFRLTDFIIDKLQPEAFNCTCKDAIDRGGASAAYYGLMKSINRGAPISRDEFETLLHGPATIVKGRGMNRHILHIWNEVDRLIMAQNESHSQSHIVIPAWLRDWHKENAIDKIYTITVDLNALQGIKDQLVQYKNEKQNGSRRLFDHVTKEQQWKLQVIEKLLTSLNNKASLQTVQLQLCKEEIDALQKGKLGKICEGILSNKGMLHEYKEASSHSIQLK